MINRYNTILLLKKIKEVARPLRKEFDGVLYHVTSRGYVREPIFITDKNRVLFLDKKESASIARLKTSLPLKLGHTF